MGKRYFEPIIDYLLDKTDEDGKISSYDSEIIQMCLKEYTVISERDEMEVAMIASGLMQVTRDDKKEHKITQDEFMDYIFLKVRKDMVAQTSN